MLAALGALLLGSCGQAGDIENKPTLKLLTTLPIQFAPRFSLDGGSNLYRTLDDRYEVEAIAATDPASLGEGDLLFMAHALPQTPENLVFLDQWVRGGGKVLLIADPRLDWDVGLPLGSPMAPPYYFGDTGLLGHWGLRLDGPYDDTEISGFKVSGPGRLEATGEGCAIEHDGLVARCTIGKGRAVVLADADLLAADDKPAIVLVTGLLEQLTQ